MFLKKKLIQLSIALMGVLSLVMVGIGYEVHSYLNNPITQNQTLPSKVVTIPKGTGFNQILKILTQEQLLDQPSRFRTLVGYRNAISKIKAGEYVIQTHWTPDELLDHLVKGRSRQYRVTLPEGLTFQQVVERLVAKGLGKQEVFLELNQNEALRQRIAITPTPESLEGFLFPETYFFTKTSTEYDILALMIDEFNKHYQEEHRQRALALGLNDLQTITLASIIEKETGSPTERALVSAVFHNRLKKKMRLESDPTVIYGIKDFDGNLTRKHLKTPTAYNTYTIRGLPPGPISNPGKASIESTLFPADVPYLYFVARGDGTSQFSSNLKAHNQAVWKYQKRKRR